MEFSLTSLEIIEYNIIKPRSLGLRTVWSFLIGNLLLYSYCPDNLGLNTFQNLQFLLPYDVFNNIFFSLVCFIMIWYIIYLIY